MGGKFVISQYEVNGGKCEFHATFPIKYEEAERIYAEMAAEEQYPIEDIIVTRGQDGLWDVSYKVQPPKFERIRRITGYLTGKLDVWNDSKRAEERDRVKHGVEW